MNDDATMNAEAGAEFEGLDRFEARKKVIEKFEELGLLEKIEDYEITLPICERCKTIVEPILSDQWFVKMDEMRDMALDLIKNEGVPHFSPQVPNEKVYTTWLENLKDWTISRQLWWGHQIPAWYDKDGNVFVAKNEEEAFEKAGTTELTQDQDVLRHLVFVGTLGIFDFRLERRCDRNGRSGKVLPDRCFGYGARHYFPVGFADDDADEEIRRQKSV